MGYSICYDGAGAAHRRVRGAKKRRGRIRYILAAIVGIVVWYSLRETQVMEWIEDLAQALGQGRPLAEAFSDFCLEILENAALE